MPTCPHGRWYSKNRYANKELACDDCATAAHEAGVAAYRKANPNWEAEEDAHEEQERLLRAERADTNTRDPKWWKEIRRIGIERRKAEVADMLNRGVWVPPEIANIPDDDLTPRQREAIGLWNAGLSFGEIAEQMDVSKTRAVQLVNRAKERIHDYWGTWDHEELAAKDG